MIAPKRTVMIDEECRTVLDEGAPPGPERAAHPSEYAGASSRSRTRARSGSREWAVRGSGRMTCSSCRITYLPGAVPPLEAAPEDWVCARCLDEPEVASADADGLSVPRE
jgi:hypothetical protein